MTDDMNLLTSYIAAWGWHITSIMFLCSLVVLISTRSGLFGSVLAGAFFASFAYSLYMAHKRKKEVYNE